MYSRRGITGFAGFILTAVLVSAITGSAREKPVQTPKLQRGAAVSTSLDRPASYLPLRSTASTDTTWLAAFSFNSGSTCLDEGWTSVDLTAQEGTYFHVDDFAGLGGGDRGLLDAPQGDQALWCGARPSTEEPLCSYSDLPGYGNSWKQRFETVDCLDVTGDVRITFLSTWDSEPGYDGTCVEFDECDGNWAHAPVFSNTYYFDCIDGWDEDTLTVDIPDSLHNSQVRLRFHFQSDGAWSDEDGLWPGDGAIVIDSLSVSDDDGAVIPTELFEAESVGDMTTVSGNWTATVPQGYGDFAGLFPGTNVVQEDNCRSNLSCLWGFFAGSTDDYGCGGYPEQPVVPYVNDRDQYISNEIWSPRIEITGSGEGFEFAYDRYDDNPLDALTFFVWHVRSIVDDCPGPWKDAGFVSDTYGPDWTRAVAQFGHVIDQGATHIQVALGVIDACRSWCGVYGTGDCHSHAPLYDNVAVYQIKQNGPAWSVRDIDLFQDTFPENGTTMGTARIDAARDILPSENAAIRPGDSTVVRAMHPSEGLAPDSYTGFGSAVYMLTTVKNGGAIAYPGAVLTTDSFRWPVVDSLTHDGATWYKVRMDTAFSDSGREFPLDDAFCADLNDGLFVPGDTICFAFCATSGPPGSATTCWTPVSGETDVLAEALDHPAECTVLPAGGDILYVDGMNFRGSQPFFDTAFDALGISDNVDRYDIRGPTSGVGNRPGSRVINAAQQLATQYSAILWDTGDLSSGLIGDGVTSDKSDDAGMLLAYLAALQAPGGVYFSGDNIANEWQYLGGNAVTLRDTYMEHVLVNGDHRGEGLPVSPLLVGTPGGCFAHIAGPDTMASDGGCPVFSRFDVLQPSGNSTLQMVYEDDVNKGAVLAQFTSNPNNATSGVFLSGVSFFSLRNDIPGNFDRAEHLGDILECLTGSPFTVTDATSPPRRFSLSNNVPNPFNPTTTIEFTVRERAAVTLRVYNVRGQLVKTLVNDTRAPGIAHRVEWDGRNAAGQRVASGVYFYRLVTKGYAKTRKMVLLK